MAVIKALWASVQGDPTFMRRVNGWLTIVWIAMIPISMTLGWVHSVTYVSALSLWALVSGHWSAWQAARVEVEQQRQVAELEKRPIEDRVVNAIVNRTDVQPAAANSAMPDLVAEATAPLPVASKRSATGRGDGRYDDTVAIE